MYICRKKKRDVFMKEGKNKMKKIEIACAHFTVLARENEIGPLFFSARLCYCTDADEK